MKNVGMVILAVCLLIVAHGIGHKSGADEKKAAIYKQIISRGTDKVAFFVPGSHHQFLTAEMASESCPGGLNVELIETMEYMPVEEERQERLFCNAICNACHSGDAKLMAGILSIAWKTARECAD